MLVIGGIGEPERDAVPRPCRLRAATHVPGRGRPWEAGLARVPPIAGRLTLACRGPTGCQRTPKGGCRICARCWSGGSQTLFYRHFMFNFLEEVTGCGYSSPSALGEFDAVWSVTTFELGAGMRAALLTDSPRMPRYSVLPPGGHSLGESPQLGEGAALGGAGDRNVRVAAGAMRVGPGPCQAGRKTRPSWLDHHPGVIPRPLPARSPATHPRDTAPVPRDP